MSAVVHEGRHGRDRPGQRAQSVVKDFRCFEDVVVRWLTRDARMTLGRFSWECTNGVGVGG